MNLNELLQCVPVFSIFNRLELETLERALCVDTYSDGHEFIRQGKRADAMYLVIEGAVKVIRKNAYSTGLDVNKTLTPGDVFGLISMIDQGPSTATCRAEGKVVAARLPHTAFDMLIHTRAPISNHFKGLVATQLARDTSSDRHLMAGLVEQIAGPQIRRIAETHLEGV